MGTFMAAGKLSMQYQPWHQGPWGWGVTGGGWGIFMMFFTVLFWALIIVGIVVLIRYLLQNTGSSRSSESALESLKHRYARGEIQKEEFEEKKKDLT